MAKDGVLAPLARLDCLAMKDTALLALEFVKFTFNLCFLGAVIWVVFHFITKYW